MELSRHRTAKQKVIPKIPDTELGGTYVKYQHEAVGSAGDDGQEPTVKKTWTFKKINSGNKLMTPDETLENFLQFYRKHPNSQHKIMLRRFPAFIERQLT